MSNLLRQPGEPLERIVGFEMEYSPSIIMTHTIEHEEGQENVQEVDYNVTKTLLSSVRGRAGWAYTERFLGNGFAAYIDCEMLEVCTPETFPQYVGLLQVASEQMVVDALSDLVTQRREKLEKYQEHATIDWLLPLRVESDSYFPMTAGVESTSGFHENYELRRSRDLEDQMSRERARAYLALYARTMSVFTGQGAIHPWYGFSIAQKINGSMSGSYEPVMFKPDRVGVRGASRIEFRGLNYPVSAWQLRYRASYTSAVIRLLEQSGWNNQLFDEFSQKFDTMTHRDRRVHHIERDVVPGIGDVFRHANDPGFVESLKFQRKLTEELIARIGSGLFPDAELEAAQKVAELLQMLADQQYDSAGLEVPWIKKALLLQRRVRGLFHVNKTIVSDDTYEMFLRAQALGLACERLSNRSNHLNKARESSEDFYTSDEIQQATSDPPMYVLAEKRAQKIKELHEFLRRKSFISYLSATAPERNSFMYEANWMSPRVERVEQ